VLGEIAAAARVLGAEVGVIERIVLQASHGRILSRVRDEVLLPAAGPIVGPETTGLVWEKPEGVQGFGGPAPFCFALPRGGLRADGPPGRQGALRDDR